jgi:hypothetical protein
MKMVWLNLLGIVILAGCSRRDSEKGAASVPAPRSGLVSANEPLGRAKVNLPPAFVVKNSEVQEHLALESKAQLLLKAKDYEGLDAVLAELRASKAADLGGNWNLAYFYSGLCDLKSEAPEAEWKSRLQEIRLWVEKKPDSIGARIALAQTLTGYAWKARGGGWANTVTDGGWKLFGERLAEARQVLFNARKLATPCPHWWAAALKVALGEGWENGVYEKLFREAIAFEPTYISYYHRKAYRLLPRWHGEPGDWENFAMTSADALGGEDGDILYARIVWAMLNCGFYEHIFKDCQLSRARVERGYAALLKRHPDSYTLLTQCCRVAGAAGDFDLQRAMFEKLAGRVDLTVWDSTKHFEAARDLAYRSSRAALLATPPSRPEATGKTVSQNASDDRPSPTRGTGLKLQGISGPKGRRLALINNQTFGPGESARVLLAEGEVRIRCEEIRQQTVIVTIDGRPDRRELSLGGG